LVDNAAEACAEESRITDVENTMDLQHLQILCGVTRANDLQTNFLNFYVHASAVTKSIKDTPAFQPMAVGAKSKEWHNLYMDLCKHFTEQCQYTTRVNSYEIVAEINKLQFNVHQSQAEIYRMDCAIQYADTVIAVKTNQLRYLTDASIVGRLDQLNSAVRMEGFTGSIRSAIDQYTKMAKQYKKKRDHVERNNKVRAHFIKLMQSEFANLKFPSHPPDTGTSVSASSSKFVLELQEALKQGKNLCQNNLENTQNMSVDVKQCFEEAQQKMHKFAEYASSLEAKPPPHSEASIASKHQLDEIWGEIEATMSGAGSGESPSSKTGGGDGGGGGSPAETTGGVGEGGGELEQTKSKLEKALDTVQKQKQTMEKTKSKLKEAQAKNKEDTEEIKKLNGEIARIKEKSGRDVDAAKERSTEDIKRRISAAVAEAMRERDELERSTTGKGAGSKAKGKDLVLAKTFEEHAKKLGELVTFLGTIDFTKDSISMDRIDSMSALIHECLRETSVNLDPQLSTRMNQLGNIVLFLATNTKETYEENTTFIGERDTAKRELSEERDKLKELREKFAQQTALSKTTKSD
jgi:hypothetical protein